MSVHFGRWRGQIVYLNKLYVIQKGGILSFFVIPVSLESLHWINFELWSKSTIYTPKWHFLNADIIDGLKYSDSDFIPE